MTEDEKITLISISAVALIFGAIAFPSMAGVVAAIGATLGVAVGVFRFGIQPAVRGAGRAVNGVTRAAAEGRERVRLEQAERVQKEDRSREELEQLRRENARMVLELQYLTTPGVSERLPRPDLDQLLNNYMNDRQPASTVESRQPLVQQTIFNLSQTNTLVQEPFGDRLRSLYEEHEQRLAAITSLPFPDHADPTHSLEDYREEMREIEERRFVDLMRKLTAGGGESDSLELPGLRRNPIS